MILKKVNISRGGGQGQFGKSLHFEFFFYDGFPKSLNVTFGYQDSWQETLFFNFFMLKCFIGS